jgi:AcrR family transcriptional regulator
MGLFARVPFDDVTVGHIAEAAEMTPAAVYYHFAGKEQILLEGIQVFSDSVLTAARSAVAAGMPLTEIMIDLLDLVRKRRTSAVVYFINSAGLNLTLETHRKFVRAELAEIFAGAASQSHDRLSAAEAGVMGAGLVSLLEVSSASMLTKDPSFKALGARKFPESVGILAGRVIGLAPV